jgi:gliding motility-associated protein GldC
MLLHKIRISVAILLLLRQNYHHMAEKSTILLEIELDEKKHPKTIHWQASDNPAENGLSPVKAFLLSLFDEASSDTLRLDLWTSKLQVSEMDRLMFQTLKSLADTYFRATNNHELANAMQSFATYFGENTGIVPKEEQQ